MEGAGVAVIAQLLAAVTLRAGLVRQNEDVPGAQRLCEQVGVQGPQSAQPDDAYRLNLFHG